MSNTAILEKPANAGKLSKPLIAAVIHTVSAVARATELAADGILVFPGVKRNGFDVLLGKESLQTGIYAKHIEELNVALQREFAKYSSLGMTVKLVPSKSINSKISNLVERGGFDDDEEGRAWPNQVETLAETIVKILENPKQSAVIIGSTQLGKTMTVILMAVLEMLLWLQTGGVNGGVIYKAIYLTPKHISITDQTKKDFQGFSAYYDFEVETQDGSFWRYSQYREFVRCKAKIDDDTNPEASDSPIMSRTVANVKQLEDLLNRVHKAGARAILVLDECHWGSEAETRDEDGNIKTRNGNMAKMLMLSLANKLIEDEAGDLVIAISATPFNLNVSKMTRIFCRTFLNYVGYAFWNGILLDKRYELRLPEVYGFGGSYIRDVLQIEGFWQVNRNYYRTLKSYELAKEKQEGRGDDKDYTPFAKEWRRKSWTTYKDFCETKLIELTKACLLEQNAKDAKGFIVRFFYRNDEITDFIKRRQKDFGNIKLVAWNEDGSRKRLDVYLDSLGISKDTLKIILVTGNGRMGARINDSLRTYYGADFSSTGTLTSLLQGLLGRLTGAKTHTPIMFVSDDLEKELDEYVKTRGASIGIKVHQRTVNVKHVMRGQDVVIYNTDIKDGISWDTCNMPGVGKELQKFVSGRLDGFDTLAKARRKPFDPQIWEFLNKQLLRLEAVLQLPKDTVVIFNPEDLPCYDRPHVDDGGHSYDGVIGFRAGKGSIENSTLKSDRLTSSNKKDQFRNLQPQFHVRKYQCGRTTKWALIAVKFRLFSRTSIGNTLHLPKLNDIGAWFSTDDEKAEVVRVTRKLPKKG